MAFSESALILHLALVPTLKNIQPFFSVKSKCAFPLKSLFSSLSI